MKSIFKFLLIMFLCLIGRECFSASEEAITKHTAKLMVSVLNKKFFLGQQPKFLITILNRSEEYIKVLDLKKRQDLIGAYLDIIITKNGKEIPFNIAISDPGLIMEEDYISIAPQKSITFLIEWYTREYHFQGSGLYNVKAEFWNYPFFKVKSETTSFVIVE